MYHRYRGGDALKRFEVAIVAMGEPVALCYGKPSKNKVILKIHTLARSPLNNPLAGNVIEIILFAAMTYASLLGCAEIWLCEPMNGRLVDVYGRHGYTTQMNKNGKVTHVVMRLEND